MRVKYLKVADGKRLSIDDFPSFSATGSIKGMKERYYGDDALLVRCGSYIYHVGNLNSSNGMVMPRGMNIYFNEAY